MSREQSIEVVGAGPTGTRSLLLDADGMQDVNANFAYLAQDLTWPLLAASVDSYIWTCVEGVWQITAARSIISVTGGASAAVMLEYCSGVTAVGSGVDQLTAALDLQETAPDRQNGVLIASPNEIFPGDSIGADFSGTLTGLVGCLTVQIKRVK